MRIVFFHSDQFYVLELVRRLGIRERQEQDGYGK